MSSKSISVYNYYSLWTIYIVEPATEIVKPAAELKKTELKQKNDASVAKSVNAAVEKNAAAPLDNGKMKQSEKAVIAQKSTEQVAETVAPQPDGAKRSFAAIVSHMFANFCLTWDIYAYLPVMRYRSNLWQTTLLRFK